METFFDCVPYPSNRSSDTSHTVYNNVAFNFKRTNSRCYYCPRSFFSAIDKARAVKKGLIVDPNVISQFFDTLLLFFPRSVWKSSFYKHSWRKSVSENLSWSDSDRIIELPRQKIGFEGQPFYLMDSSIVENLLFANQELILLGLFWGRM